MIALFEDNAGGLFAHNEETGEYACSLEHSKTGFLEDAKSWGDHIADNEYHGPTQSDIAQTCANVQVNHIASYDTITGEVTRYAPAGRAGLSYLLGITSHY